MQMKVLESYKKNLAKAPFNKLQMDRNGMEQIIFDALHKSPS
jgi:hypothetical protein